MENIQYSKEGKFTALEPVLEGVPAGMLRRMSKAVRMGIGAGLPIVKEHDVDGIIIGTANGGMEDCIKFLNQIIDYDEGLLTPGNFVQSTPNALAGQLSLATKNHCYNATHVHLGLSFENALIDAKMLLHDHPGTQYLVGGVDEISTYNYNIDFLAGWYNKTLDSANLYEANLPATIAGEGTAMFLVSDKAENAKARIAAVSTIHSTGLNIVKTGFQKFLQEQNIDETNTILVSGENGDSRLNPYYLIIEETISNIPVIRFKHLTGEYPTASSFGLWLACYALEQQGLPETLYKTEKRLNRFENVLIYNHYHGRQHSFMLVSKT